MPEGPEVRKYADALSEVLTDRNIHSLTARDERGPQVARRKWRAACGRIKSVRSHGKHLNQLNRRRLLLSFHLMMWGRWQTFAPDPPSEIDRRERARIAVNGGAAILYSAPIFNVGKREIPTQIEHWLC